MVHIYQHVPKLSFIDDSMSAEGMMKFYRELGVNIENCESFLAAYILKIASFARVTK